MKIKLGEELSYIDTYHLEKNLKFYLTTRIQKHI